MTGVELMEPVLGACVGWRNGIRTSWRLHLLQPSLVNVVSVEEYTNSNDNVSNTTASRPSNCVTHSLCTVLVDLFTFSPTEL